MPEKIDDSFDSYGENNRKVSVQSNKANGKCKKKIFNLFRNVCKEKGKTSGTEGGWENGDGKKDASKRCRNSDERKELLNRNIANNWTELPDTLKRKKEKISVEILSEFHEIEIGDVDKKKEVFDFVEDKTGFDVSVKKSECDETAKNYSDCPVYIVMKDFIRSEGSVEGLVEGSVEGPEQNQNVYSEMIFGTDRIKGEEEDEEKSKKSVKEESGEDEGEEMDEKLMKNKSLYSAAVKEMNFLFSHVARKCPREKGMFKFFEMTKDIAESEEREAMIGREISGENSSENSSEFIFNAGESAKEEVTVAVASAKSGSHSTEIASNGFDSERKKICVCETGSEPSSSVEVHFADGSNDGNDEEIVECESFGKKPETDVECDFVSERSVRFPVPAFPVSSSDPDLSVSDDSIEENSTVDSGDDEKIESGKLFDSDKIEEAIEKKEVEEEDEDEGIASERENLSKKSAEIEKSDKFDGGNEGISSKPEIVTMKLTEEQKAKKKSAEAIAKELISHIFGRKKTESVSSESSASEMNAVSENSKAEKFGPGSRPTDKGQSSDASDWTSFDEVNRQRNDMSIAEKSPSPCRNFHGFSIANWCKLFVASGSKPETSRVKSVTVEASKTDAKSKLTVPEILKRFEELGNKHFSEEVNVTDDERTITLKEIHNVLKCLEEKIGGFDNWNESFSKNQQFHDNVGVADRSESWTGRGPSQKSSSGPLFRNPPHPQPDHEEEIVQTSIDDGKHSLLQFAINHFRQSPEKFEMLKTSDGSISGSLKVIESKNKKSKEKNKGGKNSSSEWTWKEQVDLVKFTAKPIGQSLLQLDTAELSDLAVECFICLMRYMGDLPMPTDVSEVKCVYTILMHCHKFEQLRDEVYCQLMKQTTNNKSIQQESCQRGWRLFSIVAAYFVSSDTLKPFLFKYLETAAYDKRRAYHGTATVCLQNLRKTFKYGGRKNVPSVEEITAISAGRNSKRQIYRLPGGTEKVVNTKSTTVVQDVIEELCVMINVTNPQEMEEFSVYCIVEGDTFTMPLAREEYILDVTTELHKNHQVFYLIFCRSIWYFPLRLDSQLYVEVVFNQIAPDYLEGLLLVMPGESLEQEMIYDISKVAALLHKAADMTHVPTMKETKFLLPKPALSVRDVKPTQWVNMVQSNWQECENLATIQAKAQVLDILSKWPLFGSSFFAVKKAVDPKERTDHILALNKNGVHFIDLITHETLLHYPFSEVISTRKVKSEDGTLFLDMKCGNLMQQRITRLQTDQAHEISRLIRQYITMQQRMGAS